jgi:lysophospholipase L1-like esterase
VCGNDSYFNGVVRDKNNKLSPECFHPNAKGQQAIAKALLRKLG